MTTADNRTPPDAWARFRFSIVGGLLSAPPARGELAAAIGALAAKTWKHPVTDCDVRFAASTIERWYYRARRERDDPIRVLRRAVRKDRGRISLPPRLADYLRLQYGRHGHWSYQLHYDNLAALVKAEPSCGPLCSYSTVRRYMKSHGLLRKPRVRQGRPGEARAIRRREMREVRSYEAEYVGSLWHLDFHHGSLRVLTHRGQWERPLVLGILDDHSRLCCHVQWYLSETAEDLVHGLCQAFQKRGLPRALMTDNGSAMVADEVAEGLGALGIVHDKTLPYSPYQNGKQEAFWGSLEGRLMAMLDGVPKLTLDFLNRASQAWSEVEYNRRVHCEIDCAPVKRFGTAPAVLRESPSSKSLRDVFRLQTKRIQRQSDGTISVDGVRLEIPGRFRHLREITVRYARWDLSRIDVVDPRCGTVLAPIYPQDRRANADGQRMLFEQDAGPLLLEAEPGEQQDGGRDDNRLPPLLKSILAEYSATGMPPAYLPKTPDVNRGEES